MNDSNAPETALQLLGSLLRFTQTFYKLRTGREFVVPQPIGRESHVITICKALTKVVRGETKRLLINVPPRYGKTELLINFIAWSMARNPAANFIYTSYGHKLAARQTQTVRSIMQLPHYHHLFNVKLSGDTAAKDNFSTTTGGNVYAAGAGGTITGFGAGIQNYDGFGGAIIMDDVLKPSEATSDTIREATNDWFKNTLMSRLNSPDTPIIGIMQRLHEHDLAGALLNGFDGHEWETVILPALDENDNALNPSLQTVDQLKRLENTSPYIYASQYQQDPQPAGGGIYSVDDFVLMPEEPEIFATFITADTAETAKTYNDATVFSFWGVYKINDHGFDTDLYGLHWIDCHQCRVEPKDLQGEFLQFYGGCMSHACKPQFAAIEKKSTGTTLVSILSDMRGVNIMDIERTRASGSKIQRFLEAQPYIASKRVSVPQFGRHTAMVIDHMRKITANDSHAHDDIADTCADAIQLALVEGRFNKPVQTSGQSHTSQLMRKMNKQATASFGSWRS